MRALGGSIENQDKGRRDGEGENISEPGTLHAFPREESNRIRLYVSQTWYDMYHYEKGKTDTRYWYLVSSAGYHTYPVVADDYLLPV